MIKDYTVRLLQSQYDLKWTLTPIQRSTVQQYLFVFEVSHPYPELTHLM